MIVTVFRINSLIATLAMSFVIGGLASLVTGGNLIIAYSRPSFADLARTTFLSVNTSTWTMVIAVALTVVGVLFIALIGNGYDLLGLNPLYEQITLGGILLIAVGADAWSRLRTS